MVRRETVLRELSFESNVSAVGCVKQNLSGKEYGKILRALSRGCYHSLPLPVGWSAVCDCSIYRSYSLTF